MHPFTIRHADFQADAELIRIVRHEVFVVEQSVPQSLEWTGNDNDFTHVLAIDRQGGPIGTGRVNRSGQIGRMAVRKTWRNRGVGSAILEKLIQIAIQNGVNQLTLSSQLQAIEFYRRHQFEAFGDVYLDADIEHRSMRRSVTTP